MAFYHRGEQKKRPGVYIRIVNSGGSSSSAMNFPQVQPTPPTPDETDEISVGYNSSGIVTISIPGCTVTHDGNGTVTLSGLTVPVTYDDNGNVTIGG